MPTLRLPFDWSLRGALVGIVALLAATPVGAQPHVFAAGMYTNTVEVYDTATDQVIATIQVHGNPYGIAISPDGSRAYVACAAGDVVDVIDTSTLQVVRTIGVGSAPMEVSFSVDGQRAYVTNNTSVSVIDTLSETVVATFPVPGATNLHSSRTTPDGTALYVSDSSAFRTSVLDTTTGATLATFADGQTDVELSASGAQMFVTGASGGKFLILDNGTHSLTDTIGSSVYGVHVSSMAVAPDGRHIFQAHAGTPRAFSVLDVLAKKMVTGGFVGGIYPYGIALDSSGRCLFVRSNYNLDTFNVQSVLDSAPLFAVVGGFSPTNPTPFRRSFVNGNGTIAITSQPAQCGGDAIPPMTELALLPQVPPSGWHTGQVTLTMTASDTAGSGVKQIVYSVSGPQSIPETTINGPTASLSISAEGASTISFHAIDNAGNAESVQTHVVTIDATAPEISVLTPTAGRYLVGQSVSANYGCSDEVSGVATCDGSVPSGSALSTGVAGLFNFAVASSDTAGNSAEHSLSYSVSYGVCEAYDVLKPHKSGSTIPIKIRLCDEHGANLSSAQQAVTATGLQLVSSSVGVAVEDAGNANPDSNFRYDAAFGGYIFNLNTVGLSRGLWQLQLAVNGDPGAHAVTFTIGR